MMSDGTHLAGPRVDLQSGSGSVNPGRHFQIGSLDPGLIVEVPIGSMR